MNKTSVDRYLISAMHLWVYYGGLGHVNIVTSIIFAECQGRLLLMWYRPPKLSQLWLCLDLIRSSMHDTSLIVHWADYSPSIPWLSMQW